MYIYNVNAIKMFTYLYIQKKILLFNILKYLKQKFSFFIDELTIYLLLYYFVNKKYTL